MSATLRGLGLCIDDLGSTFGTSSAPPIKPGTVAEDDEGRKFRFVYNTGTVAITQYYPAIASSSATIGYVEASTGIVAKAFVGCAMTAIDSANYGWVQCGGVALCRVSAAHATTGEAMQCGGAYLTIVSNATDYHVGYAMGAITAAGNLYVYLNVD